MSLLSSLFIGGSGLTVSQKGIEVIGNNVANINTEGYSRQRLVVSSSPTLEFKGQMVGSGATVSAINRENNGFISRQLTYKKAGYGEENSKSLILAEIERMVGVSNSSLSTDLDAYFDAWQELSDNPSGTLERRQVMQAGEALATSFQSMVGDLDAVTESVNDDIKGKISSLNEQLKEVADLNVQILSAESSGVQANAMRDRRDVLLQEISEVAGVNYYEEANGMVSVQMSNGQPLVSADTVSSLETEWVGGTLQVSLVSGVKNSVLDRSDFGGEIGGMLEMRDEYIPELKDDIDVLAYNLATAVNSVHSGGVDLDGVSGTDFFSISGSGPNAWSGAASSLTMALTDPRQVAAGVIAAPNNQPGDNGNTLNMVKLQDEPLVNGSSTLNDYYAAIASRVGLDVSQNKAALESAGDSLMQMQNMRDTVAGVSINEEILMLVQYQTGYEAAARFVSTVDELMDTLIAM